METIFIDSKGVWHGWNDLLMSNSFREKHIVRHIVQNEQVVWTVLAQSRPVQINRNETLL